MSNRTSTKNVRNMQRVPHFHRSAVKNVKINGRYVCDECPYRWPRPKTLGTKRPVYDFEKRRLLIALLPKKTNDELKEMILKRKPEFKGASKMRKDDLVSALVGIVKDDSAFDPTLLVGAGK